MDKKLLTTMAGSLFLIGCALTRSDSGLNPEAVSASAVNEDSPVYEDSFSRGLYAAVGIGASRLEPDTSEVPGWDPNDRVEPAGQITVGADITKHLSIEAHSADLGSAGLSAPAVGEEGRINYHIDGVSALLYAGGNRHRFKRQGLTAYGRLGFGALENSPVGVVPYEKINSNHWLVGAGLEYMTSLGVGVRLEGISFDKDVQYAQLGLMYRTGRKQEIERPRLATAPTEEPELAAAVPVPQSVTVVDQCAGLYGTLEGVNFHTDSADLTTESMFILNKVARKFSTCEEVEIEIAAHTDSVGPESYNQTLSERRAISVAQYLANNGVSKNRLAAMAFGESKPIDTNDTWEGRARNRRVELIVR